MQACSVLVNNGTCVPQCPPAQIYDPVRFMLVTNPQYRVASGGICVQQCPGKSVPQPCMRAINIASNA